MSYFHPIESMQTTAISIIIPFIDEYDFLREAIQSVWQQGLNEMEIIVVCNHPSPPDEKRIRDMYTQVRILHELTAGSAFSRNAGLHAATGRWIQYLDVDDLLLPGKIAHQMACEDADAVVSPHLFQYLRGQTERSKWLAQDIWVGLLNSGLGSTSSMLWKREALIDADGWNTSIRSHQEYELLFRLLQAGKRIDMLDDAKTIVRERKSGSITQLTKPIRHIEGIHVRESMWRHLQSHGLTTRERENAFKQYIFRQLRGLFRQNPSLAMEKYRAYFHKNSFTPEAIHIPGYGLLYKLTGFRTTESLLRNIVKWRNG
jgi:glycosyltransferase involved in cell wall biosynthesis